MADDHVARRVWHPGAERQQAHQMAVQHRADARGSGVPGVELVQIERPWHDLISHEAFNLKGLEG